MKIGDKVIVHIGRNRGQIATITNISKSNPDDFCVDFDKDVYVDGCYYRDFYWVNKFNLTLYSLNESLYSY